MDSVWIKAKKTPRYDGFYDVKFINGEVERVEFLKGKWVQSGFTHWSGQIVLLDKKEVSRLRAMLDSASIAIRPEDVRDAAVMLARHYVARGFSSDGKKIPAVTCYQLAYALGVALEPADNTQLAKKAARLSKAQRSKVEKNLKAMGITELYASRRQYLNSDNPEILPLN